MPAYEELPDGPISITASGSAGSATGNSGGDLRIIAGELYGLAVLYTSAPATTVITGKLLYPGGVELTLFVIAAGNTNGLKYPRAALQSAVDGSALVGPCDMLNVPGRQLKLYVTGANDGTVVTLYPIIGTFQE